MRKISLILVSVLLFSCGNSEEVSISKEEYNRLKDIKPLEYPKEIIIDEDTWDITLSSDGHEYCSKNRRSSSYVCFHYIECKKCVNSAKK